MFYAKIKREKFGKCNLCLEEKILTWDHVPPQGGIDLAKVQIESISEIFGGRKEDSKLLESQNGVKFRTLCQTCNSMLGKNYDPVLNKISLDIDQVLRSNLILPSEIKIRTKPFKLIKSVIGHLIASKIEILDSKIDMIYRDVILDVNKKIPNDYHIYYWIYPYNTTVIMRDFALIDIRSSTERVGGVFSVLKYYPLAFLVTDLDHYKGLKELTKFKDVNIDDEIEIPINLYKKFGPYWPEAITNENPFLIASKAAQNGISAKIKSI
jgi:hypothetical protein